MKRSSQQKVLKGRDHFGAVFGADLGRYKGIWGRQGAPALAVPESSWQHSERSWGQRLPETVAWASVAPFYEMSIKLEKLSRTTISKHCKLTESTQIDKLLLLKTCWSFGEHSRRLWPPGLGLLPDPSASQTGQSTVLFKVRGRP